MAFAEVAFTYGGASAGEVISHELCSHRLLHVRCFENKFDLSLPFFSALKLIAFSIPLNMALS
jgi:hypothetical protein